MPQLRYAKGNPGTSILLGRLARSNDDPRAGEALQQAVDHKDEHVRDEATRALQQRPGGSSAP